MPTKIALPFLEIRQRLQQSTLPQVDRVIGIGSGGVVPASLVAYKVARPLTILPINFRAPDNTPRYEHPQLLAQIHLPSADQHLLLVDDVSVSGKTLALAKQVLDKYHVTTLVMKGQADIVLFPEITTCVQWPWQEVL